MQERVATRVEVTRFSVKIRLSALDTKYTILGPMKWRIWDPHDVKSGPG